MSLPPFKCRQGLWVILAALVLFAVTLGFGRHAPATAAAPGRVLSIAPAITEMLYALDLGDRVVGRSSYCNYPPAARRKPAVGAAVDLNEELVVGLRPDLILMVEGDAARQARLAKLTGAKVVVLETRRIEDVWTNMREIGRLTGTTPHAEAVVKRLQGRLAAAAAALPKARPAPGVFYMVWDQPLMTAGPESYLDDLIQLAGGRNVVTTRKGGAYPPYSYEALLAANPAVVLGPTHLSPALERLSKRFPHFKSRVRTVPDDLISRPGPRVVEALEAVGRALR